MDLQSVLLFQKVLFILNLDMKLGITLTVSIFLHEIPHEVGDFSYLLKQKMSKLSALASQFISAGGAFLGVYLSK